MKEVNCVDFPSCYLIASKIFDNYCNRVTLKNMCPTFCNKLNCRNVTITTTIVNEVTTVFEIESLFTQEKASDEEFKETFKSKILNRMTTKMDNKSIESNGFINLGSTTSIVNKTSLKPGVLKYSLFIPINNITEHNVETTVRNPSNFIFFVVKY